MLLSPLHGLTEIFIRGDVVAIEDRPRLVPADRHRHAFTHAGPDHVPDPQPTQVMKQPSWHSSGLTRGCPRPAGIANRISRPVKYILRDARAAWRLKLPGSPAPLDDIGQLALQYDLMRTAI